MQFNALFHPEEGLSTRLQVVSNTGTLDSPKTPKITSYLASFNPYPTAFPYGNGMVLNFYQKQESSTTKTVHKFINKGLKTYV